jgi:hypothetical protein
MPTTVLTKREIPLIVTGQFCASVAERKLQHFQRTDHARRRASIGAAWRVLVPGLLQALSPHMLSPRRFAFHWSHQPNLSMIKRAFLKEDLEEFVQNLTELERQEMACVFFRWSMELASLSESPGVSFEPQTDTGSPRISWLARN